MLTQFLLLFLADILAKRQETLLNVNMTSGIGAPLFEDGFLPHKSAIQALRDRSLDINTAICRLSTELMLHPHLRRARIQYYTPGVFDTSPWGLDMFMRPWNDEIRFGQDQTIALILKILKIPRRQTEVHVLPYVDKTKRDSLSEEIIFDRERINRLRWAG